MLHFPAYLKTFQATSNGLSNHFLINMKFSLVAIVAFVGAATAAPLLGVPAAPSTGGQPSGVGGSGSQGSGPLGISGGAGLGGSLFGNGLGGGK